MTWFRRMGTSKSFWLKMFNEQIEAKPYEIPSLSEFTLETETLCTRKNKFWTNLLERWKVMNRKQLRLNNTLYLTQTIHNNPQLTIDPIQITANAQYIPLGTVIDHNFQLLPLHLSLIHI